MKLLFAMQFELTAAQREQLRAVSPDHEIVVRHETDPEKLEGDGVEVLVTELLPSWLGTWPQLRWVQLLSAGSNHLRNHPVWSMPVAVTNASGTHAVPIAQYVTLAWLMLMHRVPDLMQFKATRTWPNRAALGGTVVRGLTVGIVGYGAIGRECARQLSALGLRVLCLKRDPSDRVHHGNNPWPGTGDPDGTIPAAWYGPEQLADFLPPCDLVVVTVPSTARTEGLIGEAELARMKPGARLIHISRGGVVDEAALAAALRAGHLAGAAVDCFVREPLRPDHVFFDTPNLIITPHMSGVFTDYWPVLFGLIVENLRRFRAGVGLLNEVSRRHGY